MRKMTAGLLVFAVLALVSGRILATEITGTVRAISGNTVTVAIEGDRAEFFFKLAGADEPISVATGKVEKVEGASVQVKIAANPPRVVMTNIEVMPPPQLTDAELKNF